MRALLRLKLPKTSVSRELPDSIVTERWRKPALFLSFQGETRYLSLLSMITLEQLKRKIEDADIITIWGHCIPDGDCYGCQIGLREIIKENYPNKTVLAIGSGLPPFFNRLSQMDIVDEDTIKRSLAILVDVSCLRRVEDKRVFLAKDFAKIDHHNPNKSGEEFPYPSVYVDHQKVSCAEIVEAFAFENGLRMNKLAAEALYLGIVTDSGCFRFYGTNKGTFAAVKRLAEYKIDPISIRNIAFYEDAKTKAFKKYLRGNAQILGRVCYVYVTPEEYLGFGLTYEEAGSLVNCLETKNTEIYCLFTEDGNGEVRGELRSNKGYPVQPVATEFHGGGHLFAAGTTTFSKEESLRVVERLNQVEQMKL